MTAPVELRSLAVADSERFYWVDGSAVLARPLYGKESQRLVESGPDALSSPSFTLTRQDVAFWDRKTSELVLVPKVGGTPTRILVAANIPRGTLTGLDEAVVWAGSLPGLSVALFTMRTREPNAKPIEVGRMTPNVQIEPAGSGFAVLERGEHEYSLWFGEGSTPLRRLHTASLDHGDDCAFEAGSAHVFFQAPANGLSVKPVPLYAVPRGGGAVSVVAPAVCPGALAVLGDDPVTVASDERCAGELPEARRREVVRHSLATGKKETILSVYTGGLFPSAIGPRSLLFDERIPLPHPEGTSPRYQERLSVLALP